MTNPHITDPTTRRQLASTLALTRRLWPARTSARRRLAAWWRLDYQTQRQTTAAQSKKGH